MNRKHWRHLSAEVDLCNDPNKFISKKKINQSNERLECQDFDYKSQTLLLFF